MPGAAQPNRLQVDQSIWIFLLIAAGLTGCMLPVITPLATSNDISVTSNWYEVYFTDPDAPYASSYRGGPDQRLAEAIESARARVDLAVLDLNLWSIRDALLSAHQHGASVRLVVESDYLDTTEIQELKEAGLPVLGDRQQGLMHNKFVIIDRNEVWTGSMNYTVRDGYRNNNNLVRLLSDRLAANYTAEFEEMFVDDRFGPSSPVNTPYPLLQLDNVQVETYFSPEDGVAEHLEALIRSAQDSIDFLAFSFTADDLAEAIRQRAAAGVAVRGVMERSQVETNAGSEYERFRQAGLAVRLDGNPANMHQKFLVIDGKIVVFGSYNFSRSAETTNDENVLIIHDPHIASLFLAEFEKIFTVAEE
jgi:phosphatidylserine/phosphatidylglycerophosphate/cardiolipin synthase-like enzyme